MRALVLVLVLAATAQAATRVAVLPLRERDTPDAAHLERAIVEAVQSVQSLQLLNAREGRLSGAKAAPRDARVDPQQAPRAAALGRELGAQRVLAVEASRLGDGRVLYLQAIDPLTAHALNSTTAPIAGDSGEVRAIDRATLKAAVVRVLDPAGYTGRVQLKVDVAGAEVQVDGHPVRGHATALDLPVGTHALRVTHPAYRDFLRFVEVPFDQTLPIAVALSAYPLAEGEMTEKLRKQAPRKKLPWWRSWWALSIAGAALTGATVGIVWGLRPTVHADRTVTYQPPPGP